MPCPVVPITFNLRNFSASQQTLEFGVLSKKDVNTGDNPNGLGSGRDILWKGQLQHGTWYEFLLHVKWTKCGSYAIDGTCTNHNGGFVEMWVNHAKVVPKTTHFTMDDDGKVHAKQGLYHCNPSVHGNCPSTSIQTIYHDGMEVAMCPTSNPYYHPNTGKCFTTEPYTSP
jgi:hypothetical protein